MKDSAAKLEQYYKKLELRERILVTLAFLATTWMAWSATLGGFLEESKAGITRDIDVVYNRLEIEVAEQRRLKALQGASPNARLASERKLLASEVEELNEKLALVLDRFVEPERMPALLEDVIQHHQGLKLKRIVSLPVQRIRLSTDPQDEAAAEVYRHPLELMFEGNYFEVMAYLGELETSQWEFGWRRFEYRVDQYPLAEVIIEIETLSREKSWIGV